MTCAGGALATGPGWKMEANVDGEEGVGITVVTEIGL